MANTDINTIQSNIKHHDKDTMSKYALFLGGTNVTHSALEVYDPLTTGYARLFMVRKPTFLTDNIPTKLNKFKHILEYGFTSIQGIGDTSVSFNTMQGGYVNKAFEIPSFAEDGTNSITVTVYEFSGSPVREVLHTWINGTTDLMSGLTHYNGADIEALQANQTAEFIYVSTDRTGNKVEYACLLANCFPRGLNTDAFNYNSGEHNIVETPIEFSATKYESIQINAYANQLIQRYKVLTNSVNLHGGYDHVRGVDPSLAQDFQNGLHYDDNSGELVPGAPDSNFAVPRTDI